jgi:hypothetical protein
MSIDLDEMDRLLAAATPGPLEMSDVPKDDRSPQLRTVEKPRGWTGVLVPYGIMYRSDVALFVFLRNNAEAMAGESRALRKLLLSLPRCLHCGARRLATRRNASAPSGYWCDGCSSFWTNRDDPNLQLPWAGVVREIDGSRCLDCGHPLTDADRAAPVCPHCGCA